MKYLLIGLFLIGCSSVPVNKEVKQKEIKWKCEEIRHTGGSVTFERCVEVKDS